ncbi:phage baseplate assembly protein V [Sulfuriflexus mobilis]|uniref:phage baseplate assembly protein V n=1 Tax=Sulfuriflexus mobilis TaxID=1811807 RepID=UPI0022B2A589|nr:phage baseplate assembly protein V [Sulfuriflexus mobilis]
MLQKLLAPLRRRIRMIVSRAVVTLVDDSLKMQSIQVQAFSGEVLDDIERFQQYGFTSVPHPGAEGIMLSVGGNRSHGVLVSVDDRRYRLKGLEGGEVALYTDEGDHIILKRGKVMEMNTDTLLIKAATKVRMETPLLETTHDIIDREALGNTNSVNGMRDIFDNHTHPGDSGGTTGNPNQVMN